MSYLLSVCISVNNTGHLLERCLESLFNQTYENIEVILVDNGSIDNSYDIMKTYKRKYSDKVKLFQQVDMGLAAGRQTGVSNSKGEFIAFLDADDYIEPQMYDLMIKRSIEVNADIVECQTQRDGEIIESPFISPVSSGIYLKSYLKHGNVPTMLWMRIYKRHLFDKPVFPTTYVNNEDNYAFPCLIYNSKRIAFLKKPLHHYMTDNDKAYMKQLLNRDINIKKIMNSKIRALESVCFVVDYLGDDMSKYYQDEYSYFLSRSLSYFLFFNYEDFPMRNRIKISSEILKIDVKKYKYILAKSTRFGFLLFILTTIFGMYKGLFIFMKLKRIKRVRKTK